MLKIQFKDRRKPAMWLVDSVLKIGSDPTCDICIKSDQVAPFHCELAVKDQDLTITNISGNKSMFINDIPVVKQHKLAAWDIIRLDDTELEIIDPLTQRAPNPEADSPKTVIRTAVSPWMLKAVSAPLDGQYFSLSHSFIIGRDSKADIVVPLDYISREHAKIALRKEKLYVEDLESSNGTYVNEDKIKSCELRADDELRLDEFKFLVIGPKETGRQAPRTIVKDAPKKEKKSRLSDTGSLSKKTYKLPKVFLHGLSKEVNGKVFEITQPSNHISRMLGHHLSTSEQSVSARHVYVNATETGWEIKNDGASDGLLVNDKMQVRAVLQDGDRVEVGGVKLYFQGNGQAPIKLKKQAEEKNSAVGKIIIAIIAVAALAAFFIFS